MACALAVDAFSVGAVVGLRHRQARQVFRLSFHFGLFQALFPMVGALAGRLVVEFIQAWAPWLVFAALGGLGARMIVSAWRGGTDHDPESDLTRGMPLIALSTAVSIDALAAGLTISATGTPIWGAIATIGLVAGGATAVAMLTAKRLPRGVTRAAEAVGGATLIVLGTRALLSGLL